MVLQRDWRIASVVLATVLLVAALAAEPARGQTKGSPYKTIKLDNGLEVIVIENHTVPLVTVDIAVRNGAFTEPDEFAGLSHLYEHMFFKSNTVIPSQERFMQRVGELGIVFNGYTSQEVVTYFFTLPSRNLDDGMKFMSDAIKHPLFKEEELVKEREVVLGEFDRNEAQPTFVLNYAIDSALWMPYVSRKQPLGQRPVIKAATNTQMRMIQDLFYVPNNSALIISGDVKPDQVFTIAKKYFVDWKKGNAPFPSYSPPPFPALKPQIVAREAKIPDVDIRMHFRGPSVGVNDPDPYIAQLFTTLIDQSTSRFYHNLVDSGLVTSAQGGYSTAHNVGTIDFYLRAPKEKARRAFDVLKGEIEAMARPGYFTAHEIDVAKGIVANQKIFERENPMSFAIRTTARWWSMASLDYYLGFSGNVSKVSAADLTALANNYMVGHPFVLGVGADHGTLDQLNFTEEALKW